MKALPNTDLFPMMCAGLLGLAFVASVGYSETGSDADPPEATDKADGDDQQQELTESSSFDETPKDEGESKPPSSTGVDYRWEPAKGWFKGTIDGDPFRYRRLNAPIDIGNDFTCVETWHESPTGSMLTHASMLRREEYFGDRLDGYTNRKYYLKSLQEHVEPREEFDTLRDFADRALVDYWRNGKVLGEVRIGDDRALVIFEFVVSDNTMRAAAPFKRTEDGRWLWVYQGKKNDEMFRPFAKGGYGFIDQDGAKIESEALPPDIPGSEAGNTD